MVATHFLSASLAASTNIGFRFICSNSKVVQIFYLMAMLSSMLYGCKSVSVDAKTADEIIRSAGTLSEQSNSMSKRNLGTFDTSATANGKDYVSKSARKELSNTFELIAFDNNKYADILYPGAIVQGKYITDKGRLVPLPKMSRTPITLTMSNGESISVDQPSKESVESSIRQLLSRNRTTHTANIKYSLSEFHSFEQSFLEVGINASWLIGSINGRFNQDKSAEKHSLLLYFKQIYYHVTVPEPSRPSAFFAGSLNGEDLKKSISMGNPPCYINNVDYGRIILVKATSTNTLEKMKAAISGVYGPIGGKLTFEKSQNMSNYEFEAFVIGGSAQGAATAVTSNDIRVINKLITDEATFSPEHPAVPISYSLRYLANPIDVNLGSTVTYAEHTWELDPTKYQVFDISFSDFGIIDDGNTLKDGKFYYTIVIQDGKGNELEKFGINREEFKRLGSGERLLISKDVVRNIILRKSSEEQLSISATLMDRFESGDDQVAGKQTMSYSYPWDFDSEKWITMKLEQEKGNYQTNLVFRIKQKK